MFRIINGGKYVVKYARSGFKKDGSPYGLIAMVEYENQPDGLERPSKSKSTVKIWLPTLPSGIKDGSVIQVHSFDGFDWKHLVHEEYGKPVFQDVIELIGAVVTLAEVGK